MQQRQVDVAIIGAGTAGLAAYRAAKAHTDSVVIIEGGPYGTTCARVGCMPSKLLIAAAEAAHSYKTTSVFGVDYPAPIIRQKDMMARVRSERDRFAGFVIDSVESFPEADRIRGYATFVNDTQLQIDGMLLTAKRIVIATGSRPVVLPFMEAAGDRLLVNDDIFELEALPEKVVVFGPGVIGLELGQALSRLGVDVRMLGVGDALGPLQDADIKAYAYRHFNKEFYLDTDAKTHSVHREGDQVLVRYTHKTKGEIEEAFDYLIAATGRRPNIDKLGLENTSLTTNERGMPDVDPFTLQTLNNAGKGTSIFIAGDANNYLPLLHEAADEGKIAGANAGQYPSVRAGKRRTPLGVVFTEPQIATIGLSLPQVKERCQACYATGEISFEDQGRSRVMGKNHGLLKVYGEQGTGLLLGAEMFGPAAEHIAHLLSWAVQARMTVSQVLDMPFYHPVIEEGVRTALRDLNHKLHIGPAVVARCLDCGPGA